MSGPFQMIGDEEAPVCVDGVCALPQAGVRDAADQRLEGSPHAMSSHEIGTDHGDRPGAGREERDA